MKVRNGKQLLRKMREVERSQVCVEVTVKRGHRWSRPVAIEPDFAQKSLLFVSVLDDRRKAVLSQLPSGDALSALQKVYNAQRSSG